MDIRTRLVFALVAVSLGSMFVLGAVVAPRVDGYIRDGTLQQLDELAEAKRETLRWIIAGWRDGADLVASRTLTDTEDKTTGRQLARRPKHRGVVSLFYKPTDRWRAQATLIAVADRIDSDGSALDDYERVDVTVQYRVSAHLEPYLRVENLFDEDYEEVNGFATTGALAVVGVGLRF